jgi:hypothetical protein
MRYCHLILFTILLTTFTAYSQSDYFQQEVNVKIDVALNDLNHTLSGNIEMEYFNNAPTELDEIYMHLWANAYKNRQTAFNRQKLRQGSTRFYFAKDSDMGNFSELDFKVNDRTVDWDYDPANPDIAILKLNDPLLPGERILITTPLRLKIPASFSRLGHVGQSYQLTQWYPKPAVYDKDGWHPMPYLDMGEFYSEFGDYEVNITLPKNYVVGATGVLQNEEEYDFLEERIEYTNQLMESVDTLPSNSPFPESAPATKTLRYLAEDVHDFAWFADKRFYVQKSEVELASGRKVDTWVMFTNEEADMWKEAINYVDRSVKFYSEKVGEYPYPQASAVQSALSAGGGMEYPMITVIGLMGDPQSLDNVITHEVGHNWFYGILAFNERDHVWMDEGLNSYYDHRYTYQYYENDGMEVLPASLMKSSDMTQLETAYLFQARRNKDQPPATHSDDFSRINYWLGGYEKPAQFFRMTEMYLGTGEFDRIMQSFYENWAFKHPQPDDLRAHFESSTDKDLDWLFDGMIHSSGKIDYAIKGIQNGRTLKLTIENQGDISSPFPVSGLKDGEIVATQWFDGFEGTEQVEFNAGDYDQVVIDQQRFTLDVDRRNNNIKTSGPFKTLEPLRLKFIAGIENSKKTTLYWLPLLTYNAYDELMLGAALYNTTLPANKFEFSLAPMYATATNDVVGLANLKYNIFPKRSKTSKISFDLALRRYNFNYIERDDYYLNYNRISPGITFQFGGKDASPIRQSLSARAILIWDEVAQRDTIGTYIGNEVEDSKLFRLTYQLHNRKAPNPYALQVQLEQQSYTGFTGDQDYLKASLTFKNAFAYKPGRAIHVRLFAGGFLQNSRREAGNVSNRGTRGSFALTSQGFNDYAYDRLFLGRSEQDGLWSQQISIHEGGMKNAFGSAYGIGQSNNFIFSCNIKADLPRRLPLGIPLKPYFDFGYFDNATPLGDNATFSDQFLWSGGLMLEFFKGRIGLYFPLINSENMDIPYADKDNYWGRVTFNIDFQRLNPWEIVDGLEF